MAEENPELTTALDEARKRRADLHAALIDVERAISGPATGREQEWSTEVVTRLLALRDALDEHIEATERTDGLYDEITHRAPRLSNAIQRLQAEHPEMRSAISQTALDTGERLTVFFPPLGAQQGWDAYGRVLRCEPGNFGYRLAVEFDPLPAA